jgi:putative ABC transport system ATP-binding protein
MTAEPRTAAVEVKDVSRVYKVGGSGGTNREVQALRGVSLSIEEGCLTALKGRSGSGKTTLMNCIGGLDAPTSGVVRVFGSEIARMKDRELTHWRREQVGFIFQSFGLLPTLSAYENVELALRLAGQGYRERRQRTLHLLDLVGLTKWRDHRPYELSGGQQQRVGIARALANQPRLILADEPTGELDSVTAREILALFARLSHDGQMTILIASHDPQVDGFADHVHRLQDGQLVVPS